MTESTNSTPDTLSAKNSPMMFDPGSYVAIMRQQFETTLQLTTAWATAMSAISSRMFTQVPTLNLSEVGVQSPSGAWSATARRLTAVHGADTDSTPTAERPAAEHPWAPRTLEPHAPGGMLRWLTEPPTLQTSLFDEAVELLVDEDIKTAS